MTPIAIANSTMTAPGAVSRRLEHALEEAADPAPPGTPGWRRDLGEPRGRRRRRWPSPGGSSPSPWADAVLEIPAGRQQDERQQPAHRPEPRATAGPPVGRLPWPGRTRAMKVIAPRISRTSPTIERTTSGVNRAPNSTRACASARSGGTSGCAPPGRHPLDLDDDREDHRPALRLLVQVARDAVLDLGLEQCDLVDVLARRRDRRDDAFDGSSMSGSFSLRWTKPRVTISGRPTTAPVCFRRSRRS